MAGASKIVRIVIGVPVLVLFSAWALWEFGKLRMPLSAQLIGYDTAKVIFFSFASYVAWRAWRWVSGKDATFGKTPKTASPAQDK